MEVSKNAQELNAFGKNSMGPGLRTEAKNKKKEFVYWMEQKGYLKKDENGKWRLPAWNVKEDRIAAVRKIIELLGIKPTELTNSDFFEIGAFELLKSYSTRKTQFPAVFNALKEAYPEENINLWDISSVRPTISKNIEVAHEAVRWVAKNNGGKISEELLRKNNMEFVLSIYNNVFDAVIFSETAEVNPETISELASMYMDKAFLLNEKKRIAAIRFVASRVGDAYKVSYKDFETFGMSGIMDYYVQHTWSDQTPAESEIKNSATALALSIAIKGFNIWQVQTPPKLLFIDKKTRVRAVKWLSGATGVTLLKLTKSDWEKYNLSWMLEEYYNGDTRSAAIEAMNFD